MNSSDLKRAALHFPVGMLAIWLTIILPLAGVIFTVGFMFYETLEDWRIADLSYKDMFGFLCGYGVGGFIAGILV